MTNTIPRLPRLPIIGNLHQMSGKPPIQTMLEFSKKYGSIYELKLINRKLIIVSDSKLIDELCDEKRFHKIVAGPVEKLRVLAGDGLFTAHNTEPNWQKAHNILLPGMSMIAMKTYFPRMLDVAWKLLGKWGKAAETKIEVDVPHDMSRLTFDTIGLCGFDYDFHSFASDKLHPFVDSMNYCLEETLRNFYKLPYSTLFEFKQRKKFADSLAMMNKTVDDVIKDRISSGKTGSHDFLDLMLNGTDKATGEKLSNENIRYQVLTFLIAGHETTSGLISFAVNFLINDPVALRKAYDEVDKVLGNNLNESPDYRSISELKYINQILKESLRLWAPASGFRLSAYEDTTLGPYKVAKGDMLFALLPALHRDQEVWGSYPDRFDPEHFSEAAEAARPANAYKPFGNGMRACIGRQFAMVEATLILSMILQRFKLINYSGYQLKIKELITIKPDDFRIKVENRLDSDRTISNGIRLGSKKEQLQATDHTANHPKHNTPLLVLFGSNMGSCEQIANQLCNEGIQRGFTVKLYSLDDYTADLPTTGAVVIISSTYNGNPPDNAVKFMKRLSESASPDKYTGVKYTVMGCGNSDWKTFQVIPRLIDEQLYKLSAKRIHPLGEGDANGDFESQYERWHDTLWKDIESEFAITTSSENVFKSQGLFNIQYYENEVAQHIPVANAARKMKVIKNYELQNFESSGRSTRHIELELPAGVNYTPGDHLGVISRNSPELVKRVVARFNLNPSVVLKITKSGEGNTSLPVDEMIRLQNLLEDFVELQEVATRKQLKKLLDYTICPPEKKKLEWLINDDENGYMKYVLEAKRSLLDLLDDFAACELPFAMYLEMLPALRPRFYSISSTQHHNPDSCSITVSVLDVPAKSGNGNYKGSCSNYLYSVAAGKYIDAYTKEPVSSFRLPADNSVPVIMIGPGTGFAPFRGFLQERQCQKNHSAQLGKAILFYGCRHPEHDFIYRNELADFEKNGITKLVTAFSRNGENIKEYVQHKVYEHKEELWHMMLAGGIIYICGDGGKMEPDVRKTLEKIYAEKSGDTSHSWVDRLIEQNKYLTDVCVSF